MNYLMNGLAALAFIVLFSPPNPFLTQRFIPTHMTVRELPSLRKEYFHP